MKRALSCSKIQSLLWDYIAQCLPGAEAFEIDSHLTTCGQCQAVLAELEPLVFSSTTLKHTPLPASQGSWEELHQQILSTSAPRKTLWLPSLPLLKGTALTLVLGGLALIAFRVQPEKPKQVAQDRPQRELKLPESIRQQDKPTSWTNPPKHQPLVTVGAKPKPENRLSNALYKTKRRTHIPIRKPETTLVKREVPPIEEDTRTVVAVKFAVDGEMPIGQTRHVFGNNTANAPHEPTNETPRPTLASQHSESKELIPW